MTDIEFTSTLGVELVQSVGDDATIARAAKVSTGSDDKESSPAALIGLIGYLMKKRHGSPFEHNSITFKIDAPIFVVREFMRHRIGWSYNEISGRYMKLEPKFYVYPEDRPLVQTGSGAHPKLEQGGAWLNTSVNGSIKSSARKAWWEYEHMLELGAANEVVRAALPVGTYTSWYATCNARSLMSFLSLRVDDEKNAFDTKPQWEIQQVALQMEAEFAKLFPVTHGAFNTYGRVSP